MIREKANHIKHLVYRLPKFSRSLEHNKFFFVCFFVVLCVIHLFALGLSENIELLPDLLGFANVLDIDESLSLITATVGTFLSIYITLFLIAFQSFQAKAKGKDEAITYFNFNNVLFIGFSLSLVLLSFFSKIFLHGLTPNMQLTVIYYNFICFIVFITSIFPIVQYQFSSLHPLSRAYLLIKQLEEKDFTEDIANPSTFQNYLEQVSNHKLHSISIITLSFLADTNAINTASLITKVTNKLIGLTEKPSTKFDYDSLIIQIERFYKTILQHLNSSPIEANIKTAIILSIGDVYQSLNRNKKSIQVFGTFNNNFFKEFLSTSTSNSKSEQLKNSLSIFSVIIRDQYLHNTSESNEIPSLLHILRLYDPTYPFPLQFTEEQRAADQNWHEITTQYFNSCRHIINDTIESLNDKSAKIALSEMQNFARSICFSKLNITKKHYILQQTSILLTDGCIRFANSFKSESHSLPSPLPSFMTQIIDSCNLVSLEIIQHYGKWILFLEKKQLLGSNQLGDDVRSEFVTWEGELGMLMRYCCMQKNFNEFHITVIVKIIDFWEHLVNVLLDNSDRNKQNLASLCLRVETTLKILSEKENDDLVTRLNRLYQKTQPHILFD